MIKVNEDRCTGCGLCAKDCFIGDIELTDKKANVKNVTCINCGHCIAVCPSNAISADENMKDVVDYNESDFSISPDNLLNFIKFRRSIRHFKNKDVENQMLNKIIEAGRFTQTGSNSQNISYVVIKDEINKLRDLTFESLNKIGKEMIENKSNYPEIYMRYANMWINMYDAYIKDNKNDRIFFNAPAVILVVSESEVNASLAASNMELMTNALGLGTFFSGFFIRAAQGNKEIMDFLGLDENKKIVNCMIVGHPAVKYQRTVPRKSPEINWK